MIADVTVIREAIQSYAVILNRPQWLDETRMLMQVAVWDRLVNAHRDRGTVGLHHFERAITQLTAEQRALDITVAQIVTRACSYAADETDIVARLYAAWEGGGQLLHDQATRFVHGSIDLDTFRAEVNELQRMVALSVLDDSETEAIVSHLDLERGAVEEYVQPSATPVLLPPDDEEVDAVVAEWLSGQ